MRSVTPVLVSLLVGAVGCSPSTPPGGELTGAVAPAEPGTEIPNPRYAAWAKFPVGTVVVHRTVTRADGVTEVTVTTTTRTLVEVAADKVAVETNTETRRFDGHVTANRPTRESYPRTLVLPPGVPAGRPAGVTDEGEEVLTVAGKEYRTTWHKTRDRNEAGEVLTQTWMSPAVPGGLVRSVMRTAAIGKTTTEELVEVRAAGR